jgi:hypothetical protein
VVANGALHKRHCKVCKHPNLAEIDRSFIGWEPPSSIARENHFNVRALFRHAHATGLFAKRDTNVRAALSRIIEKGMSLRKVTASAVVQAVAVLSKINAAGKWIDRSQTVNLGDLFERMSDQEMEEYAAHGTLPRWFTEIAGPVSDTTSKALENGDAVE